MASTDTKPLPTATVTGKMGNQTKKGKRKRIRNFAKKSAAAAAAGEKFEAPITTAASASVVEVENDDIKQQSSAAIANNESQELKRKRSDDNDNSKSSDEEPTKDTEETPSSSSSSTTVITKVAPANNGFPTIQPPLSSSILSFLAKPPYNFPVPTPVQSTTIPLFLTHHDVFVRAVTGSGKTLAFLIPVVEMILRRTTLLKKNQIGSLILEPTRELARQTYKVCGDLCGAVGMNAPLLLVGGGGSDKGVSAVANDLHQFAKLQSDIIIGTPGRVEDILTRYDNVDVSELEVLILDESDVLLDMGFEVTLTSILGRLPRMRRTGLFSATNTSGVKRLCVKSGMRNPVVVDVAINAGATGTVDGTVAKKAKQQATPSSLTNYYIIAPLDEQLSRLMAFLRQHSEEKVIIFFLTCACVEYYSTVLKQLEPPAKGYEFEVLHGKLVQKRREKAMERFREEKKSVGSALLCTDVAARGLDLPDITWTIQFDAPVDPSSYVHRVGRSARAGRTGNSLVFLTRKEEAYVDFLRLRKVPVRELGMEEICRPPPPVEEEDGDEEKMDEESGDDDGEKMEVDGEEDASSAKKESKPKKVSPAVDYSKGETRIILSAAGPDVFVPDVLPAIRQLVLKDRDILEKGTKAYTSYIRAYKEHHCGFIFRFASVDLGLLATAFSLLRLPKMPELRDKRNIPSFVPAGPEVNIHGIGFKDKIREKSRQKRLAAELASGGKNAKQIKAEQRAAERIAKSKEKRAGEIAKGRNPNKKKKGRQQKIFDEWDDLAKEERLHKKLKQKKISKEEYDRLMYGGTKTTGADDDDSDSD